MLNGEIFKGLVEVGDKVLVGVSGGADSMCLLSLLQEYARDVDCSIYVVHVNHNIREKEAERDQLFVENYCKTIGLPFKTVQIKAKEVAQSENKTLEQAARDLRYKVFEDIAQSIGANKIAVAHHSGDQAETVLMHIARGSSIKGARGMKRQSGKIIRPLLNCSKNDILDYVKKNEIAFVEDSTNEDTKYARNFVRNKIIPTMSELYLNVQASLCSFANHCARDDDFIESVLPLKLLEQNKTGVLIKDQASSLHLAISSRLIKRAVEKLGVFADIEEKHFKQILELFTLKSGSELCLPNKLYAYRDYDGVTLTIGRKKTKLVSQKFALGELAIKGYGSIYAIDITDKQEPEFGDGNHYVDYQKIPMNAVWRTKKDGDIFAKLGSGSKKLSDYFTDKKIPRRQRDKIPVLAVDNKILLVAGLDISELVKIDSRTEQISKVIYMPKELY